MSYKCGICKDLVVGQTPHKVVTKTRHKVYRDGGFGREIAEERDLCDSCNSIWESRKAEKQVNATKVNATKSEVKSFEELVVS